MRRRGSKDDNDTACIIPACVMSGNVGVKEGERAISDGEPGLLNESTDRVNDAGGRGGGVTA